jgi:uncharacterized RDD family membrane protein YckC
MRAKKRIKGAARLWMGNAENLQAYTKKAQADLFSTNRDELKLDVVIDSEMLDASNYMPESKTKPRIDKTYPWQRLSARIIDYQISALIISGLIFYTALVPEYVINAIYDPKAPLLVTAMVFGFFSSALWVVLEPLLLSQFQTTPGKALLRLRLVSKDSNPNYWKRSFAVWAVGIGFGIPLISMFAMLIAANRLKPRGIADWDRWTGFKVDSEALGFNRGVVVVVLIALITANRMTFLSSSTPPAQQQGIYQASNAAQIQNGDINKMSEHPIFVETYHNETDSLLTPVQRLYQTRDILANKVYKGVFSETLVKELISTLHAGDFEQQGQEKLSVQKQQVSLTVQEEIDKIPVLSYWQKNNPDIFQKCVEIDNLLKTDPKTANLTLSERFKKVADAATQIYGNPIKTVMQR